LFGQSGGIPQSLVGQIEMVSTIKAAARLWLAFTIVSVGTTMAEAVDGDEIDAAGLPEHSELPTRHSHCSLLRLTCWDAGLNLMEMFTGVTGPARIDVGLDWKVRCTPAPSTPSNACLPRSVRKCSGYRSHAST
jgi:hypothetical protein